MGFEVIWTKRAETNLGNVKKFLKDNWTLKVRIEFSTKVKNIIELLTINNNLGSVINKHSDTRKILVTKHNYLYYRVKNNKLFIVNFLDTRKRKS